MNSKSQKNAGSRGKKTNAVPKASNNKKGSFNNKKKLKINKGLVLRISVAAVVLAAITVGLVLGLDYYFVDTPYDGINLPKHVRVAKYFGAELSKKEVDEAFEEEKQKILDEYTVKIPVKNGEIAAGQNVTVTLDCYFWDDSAEDGKKQGDQIKEISVSDYEITKIGSHEDEDGNKFFPELQDRLLGVNFNFEDEYYNNVVTLKHTYPEDYSVEEVKGKTVMHYIYITEVTDSDVPEYNDALFSEHSSEIGFDSVKAYEDYMINLIELNLLWNKIVENSAVLSYPEKKTKPLMEEFDAYYNAYMQQNQLTFEQLLTQLETDEAGYSAARQAYAEGTVKEEMILYEIIQAEKIRLSGKEYRERVEELAADTGYASSKAFIEDYGKETAYRSAIWEKVKEIILSKAVRVD